MDLSCGREIQVKFYWLKTEREEMVKKLIIRKCRNSGNKISIYEKT